MMETPSDRPRLGIRLHGGLAPQRCVELAVAAEAHGFAWAAWVHSGSIGFSLVEREGSAELDPGVLRALGFEKMVEPH